MQRLVEPVNPDSYELFDEEARLRLQGRDEDDWPILATALSLSCPIWTEDTDFLELVLPPGRPIALKSISYLRFIVPKHRRNNYASWVKLSLDNTSPQTTLSVALIEPCSKKELLIPDNMR